MNDRLLRNPVVIGDCRFESRFLSNLWRLVQRDQVIADLRRMPSRHISMLHIPGQPTVELRPTSWGTVVALDPDENERGRIERQSWWGRRWEITGSGFACALTSDPLPRRWTLRLGTEPVARLSGTAWSYNRLAVHADLAVPVVSLALAWHVLARPWEAAAAPGALVPVRREPFRIISDHG
jgi:hypothetical protein